MLFGFSFVICVCCSVVCRCGKCGLLGWFSWVRLIVVLVGVKFSGLMYRLFICLGVNSVKCWCLVVM